jgi:acrylyl-CoA reductase (NADPH)
MAVSLLAKRGYTVEAVTGRASEADYLRGLGASAIVDRAELTQPPKLLGKERWAGGIDAVGGTVLANVLSQTRAWGAVAACGNAAGMELPTSVAPFILRGVTLTGIESVRAPKGQRLEAWKHLAAELDRAKLAAMTTTIGFDAIVNAAHDIVAGKVRGRLAVEIG